ncbi:MAG TPA: zinc-ribbon domain-containing protein [Pyrinomonadaceae bacterium]|nr:zinc-ribbon domain-containing protein [Pyrinomonadaceae bacterium]
MIIRCDNCSVSLQLDEGKIPTQNFTVRCPRCQNLIRIQKGSTAQQLEATSPAPAVSDGAQDFSIKESEFQINTALRSLLSALQTENKVLGQSDNSGEKPRRILLCLGQKRDEVGKVLVDAGFKVYVAQTPAQANERLREGKTEILIFSPDFAAEFGGAAILQQKVNAMYSSERRRLYLISLEDKGSTMNAHEAFLRNLNLIVNTSDIPQLPIILNRALRDFNDLYHYFNRALQLEPI